MSIEQIRKLQLKEGDVLQLPSTTPPEEVYRIAGLLQEAGYPNVLIVASDDVSVLSEDAMNAHGWYRRGGGEGT